MLIEFTGVPCCGKSVVSHELANILREQGVSVCEKQFELSHGGNFAKRASKKALSCLCYCIQHPWRAIQYCRLLRSVQQWMNYIYLLSHSCKSEICILEQGYLQLIGSFFDNAAPETEKMDVLFKALIPSSDMINVFVSVSKETVQKRASTRADRPFYAQAEDPEMSLNYAIATSEKLQQLWLQNKGEQSSICVSNDKENSQREAAQAVFDAMKQKGFL